jgi:predicted O-methyltransferase YrrM
VNIIEELRSLATRDEQSFTRHGPSGYRAIDEMAVELEVAEFLHALVRATKPARCVESGAGKGYSTAAIADALRLNGFGMLWSYEPDEHYRRIALSRVAEIGFAAVLDGDSRDSPAVPEFVFLDSGPEIRPAEIAHWLRVQGILLIVHDAYRYPELRGGAGFLLRTPRGLWFRDERT